MCWRATPATPRVRVIVREVTGLKRLKPGRSGGQGFGGRPDAFEAVGVGVEQVAVAVALEVEDGGLCCRGAVDVWVDEHLVVGAVEGVVQHGGVQADLYCGCIQQQPVEHDDVADLRRHGLGDAFFGSAEGDLLAIGIAEQDADGHPVLGLVAHDPDEVDVLGEEQSRVDEDADLVLAAGEQLPPELAGYRAPVGVGREDFPVDRRCQPPGQVRPQVVLVSLNEIRQPPAVPRLGQAPGEPALHRLGVDAEGLGDVGLP